MKSINTLETSCFISVIENERLAEDEVASQKFQLLNGPLKEKLLEKYMEAKGKLPPIKNVEAFVTKGHQMKKIATPAIVEVRDCFLLAFMPVAKYVVRIELNRGELSDEMCSKLLDGAEGLEELKLKRIRGISDKTIKSILESTKLRRLELSHLDLKDQYFAHKPSCDDLKGLKIKNSPNLTLKGLLPLLNKYATSLEQLSLLDIDPSFNSDENCSFLLDCKDLKILELDSKPQVRSFHWVQRKVEKLTEASLSSFCASPHQLTKIALRNNGLSEEGMSYLFLNGSHLSTIAFSGASNLSDKILGSIGLNCPSLERLELDGIIQLTDKGISALVQHTPTIKHLSFNKCFQITEKSLTSISLHFPQLRSLSLSDVSLSSGSDLSTLFTNCKYLTHLDISKNSSLKIDDFAHIQSHSLKRLNISEIIKADPSKLELLSFPSLSHLTIGPFTCDPSRENVQALISSCPNLVQLNANRWVSESLVQIPNIRIERV